MFLFRMNGKYIVFIQHVFVLFRMKGKVNVIHKTTCVFVCLSQVVRMNGKYALFIKHVFVCALFSDEGTINGIYSTTPCFFRRTKGAYTFFVLFAAFFVYRTRAFFADDGEVHFVLTTSFLGLRARKFYLKTNSVSIYLSAEGEVNFIISSPPLGAAPPPPNKKNIQKKAHTHTHTHTHNPQTNKKAQTKTAKTQKTLNTQKNTKKQHKNT